MLHLKVCLLKLAGMEASVVRGTKTYANFSVSGEKLINSDFRKSMGFWFPKLKKEIWRGVRCTDSEHANVNKSKMLSNNSERYTRQQGR